jgi:hypothetical protein
LSIALATNSALPLQPLSISTKGLTQGASLTVKFSNSNGYSAQAKPLSVDTNGTLLVAVPLYVDHSTHKISTGTVNVVVEQKLSNGSTGPQSSPAPLTIQSPPAVTGVQSGQISHQFLTALALAVQNRISDLEFFEISSNGAIDTSASRQSETALLKSIIATRNDVDAIMSDPTSTVAAGKAKDGSTLQFTSDSLDVMDSVIAIWVSGLPLKAAPSSLLREKLSRGSLSSSLTGIMDTVNSLTKELGTWTGLANDVKTLQSDSSTTVDNTLAVVDGTANSLSLLGTSTEAVGVFTGVAGAANAAYHYLNDWGEITTDVAKCVGTGPCSTTTDDVTAFEEKGAGDLVSAYVHAGMSNLDYLYEGALTGPASLAASCYDLVSGNGQKQDNSDMSNGIASLRNGGAWMSGPVQDDRTQSGLDLILVDAKPFDGAAFPMTGITDSNGTYSLPIPTNTSDKIASSVTLNTYDPTTGDVDGTENVSLSGVNFGQSVTVPAVGISVFPADIPAGTYAISTKTCVDPTDPSTCYDVSLPSVSVTDANQLAEELMSDFQSAASAAGAACNGMAAGCTCSVNVGFTPFNGTSFTATFTASATCCDPVAGCASASGSVSLTVALK